MASAPRARGLVLLALFLSGAAGLVHEVVWAKLLANLTGSTAKSHAVVLSVFMGGLAIGAVLFGRRSDKRERPLMVYVALEVLVGAYCLALPFITRFAGAIYETAAASAFESPGLKVPLRLLLSIAVVAVPAILMGGTLPVLARYLIEEVAQTRKAVASLYALNNLGAVVGSGTAGFYLLPAFGIYGSLVTASALNFAAAAIVWLLARRAEPRAVESSAALAPDAAPSPSYSASQYRAALWALALSGFAAMGYEVVFLRVIALGFGSSTYSFTVMLMCFITGIGLGSWIVSVARVRRPMWWLALSQLGAIASLLAFTPYFGGRLAYLVSSLRTQVLTGPPDALVPIESGFEIFLSGQAGYCLAMLLIPTVCIGFGFPLVAQIQARSVAHIGGTVGSTYAWNTVGNVLGVVVTSLVLLPALGIENSLHANLALNAVAAAFLLAAATEAEPRARWLAPLATGAVLLLYVGLGLGWSRTLTCAEGHLRMRTGPPKGAAAWTTERHPATSFEAWKQRHVRDAALDRDGYQEFFLDEDPDTNVLAVKRDRSASLFINGKADASTNQFDMVTFVLTGHLPMFLNPGAKDVMVIGHGAGVTTGAVLQHPVERVDVVEISQGVLDADFVFADANHHCLSDPRTHVYLDDARTYLRTVPRKYDLIVSNPSNPWIAGIGSLFTVDFFRDCRDRLQEGGAMVVWFHHYEQSDETVQLIVRSVGHVFPFAECFLTCEGDVIALCSMQPLAPDFARMEERFEDPKVRGDLARVAVFNLSSLLSYHAVGSTRFHAPDVVGTGPLNTDDHQLLEYKGAYNMFVGRDASLLIRDQGFATDGESLLARYVAWRAAQADLVTKDELRIAGLTTGHFVEPDNGTLRALVRASPPGTDAPALKAESRQVARILAHLAQAPERSGEATRVSRGGTPPLDSMAFPEALNRGSLAGQAGDNARAAELFRRALEVVPDNGSALAALCQLLMMEGRGPEAEAMLNEAVAKREQGAYIDTNLDIKLAFIYQNTQRMTEARQIYERLADYEENAFALSMLGQFVAGMDQKPDEAALLLERALRRDPKLWQAAVNLGLIYLQRGDVKRALAVVDDGLYYSPNAEDLKRLRAQIVPQLGAPASAQPGG